MPENRRAGEVREGHLKIFEIISTQSWTVWGAGRRDSVDERSACSNSNPAVLGVPHAPRIPPLNLVPSPSLGKREKSPGDQVGH